jgi:hypothetical protein
VSLHAVAIILAVLGALAELAGLGMVIREIASDRDRARGLLDKERRWKSGVRTPPRRVSPSSLEARSRFSVGSLQPGDVQRHFAAQAAALVSAHNQLVHDVDEAVDRRTSELLEAIDTGDKELRDVLRELLHGSVTERYFGVVAIAAGILLSMAASILSSLPA